LIVVRSARRNDVLVVFSVVAVVAVALTMLLVVVVFFAVCDGDEDAVRDVQRFVELTEEARSLLPGGYTLSDPNGETSAAIGQFLAKKEEARQALWESRQSRAAEGATPTESPAQPDANRARVRRRPERRSASRRTVGAR
jgi:hypothetical protein